MKFSASWYFLPKEILAKIQSNRTNLNTSIKFLVRKLNEVDEGFRKSRAWKFPYPHPCGFFFRLGCLTVKKSRKKFRKTSKLTYFFFYVHIFSITSTKYSNESLEGSRVKDTRFWKSIESSFCRIIVLYALSTILSLYLVYII